MVTQPRAANENLPIGQVGKYCASCGIFFHLTQDQVKRQVMTCGQPVCRTAYAAYRRRVEYEQRLERRRHKQHPQSQPGVSDATRRG